MSTCIQKILIAIFLCLSINSTSHGAPAPAKTPKNEALNQFQKLSVLDQATILSALVRKAGGLCAEVSRVFIRGQDKAGAAHIAIRCIDAADFQIILSANKTGSTQVSDCKTLKKNTQIDCWQKL